MYGATVRVPFPNRWRATGLRRCQAASRFRCTSGPGETVEEAAARTRDAIDAVMPLLNAGHDVLLVAHAHVLRILTSQWLDVDPHFARLLRLDTAHYCVLSQYKGDNVIEHWNC